MQESVVSFSCCKLDKLAIYCKFPPDVSSAANQFSLAPADRHPPSDESSTLAMSSPPRPLPWDNLMADDIIIVPAILQANMPAVKNKHLQLPENTETL